MCEPGALPRPSVGEREYCARHAAHLRQSSGPARGSFCSAASDAVSIGAPADRTLSDVGAVDAWLPPSEPRLALLRRPSVPGLPPSSFDCYYYYYYYFPIGKLGVPRCLSLQVDVIVAVHKYEISDSIGFGALVSSRGAWRCASRSLAVPHRWRITSNCIGRHQPRGGHGDRPWRIIQRLPFSRSS